MFGFRKSKLLSQFLIFGILLAVVPVFVLGCFAYATVTRRIDDNANLANQKLLELMTSEAEEQLMRIDHNVLEMSTLPSTMEAISLSAYKYNWITFENINSLKRRMEEIRSLAESAGGFTIELTLISELGHWVIDNGGFYASSVERVQGALQLATRTLQNERAQSTIYGTKMSSDAENLYLVRGIYGPNGSHYGTLIASIPKSALLSGVREAAQNENLLVLDHEQKVLAARAEAFASEAFLEQYHTQIAQGGSFTANVAGQRWGVSVTASRFAPEWRYVRLVSYSPLTDERALFGGMLLIIALSVLSVALFALFAFSHRLYKPIDALISRVRPEVPAQEEGQDEFSIISRYVSTVNESKRLLEGMLEEQQGQLRRLFFVNLLEGQLSHDQTASRAQRLGLSAHTGWLCVSLYRIERIADSDFDGSDADLVLFAVKNIADELLGREGALYSGVHGNEFVIVHQLTGSQEQARQAVARHAARLLEVASGALRVRFGSGVSELYADLHYTAEAYRHASYALKYRKRADENPIGFYERSSGEEPGGFQLPAQPLEALQEAIRKGDAPEAQARLHRCIEALFERSVPYTEFEYAILRVALGILESMHACAHIGGELSPPPDLAGLLQLGYSREAERWLLQNLLEPFFALREQEQPLSLSEQVARIVQEEYDSPLTLEYCSSKVGYHPSYVSRVFRQQMGYSFKEYLCLYRIGRSKQMLSGTDLKIQEISNRLCYNNPQNFIRVFKKVEGMTPGEYRAKYGADTPS